MPTRVSYWHDKETPDNTGWYICHYGTLTDMLANSPQDTIGPYDTEAEAKRILIETTTVENADEREEKRVRPYDPSRDPTPATLDAGIPTNYDDEPTVETSPGKGVQLELQQTQELRDVPPKVQGD